MLFHLLGMMFIRLYGEFSSSVRTLLPDLGSVKLKHFSRRQSMTCSLDTAITVVTSLHEAAPRLSIFILSGPVPC